ncbi:MAG: DUF4364 family protein [Oscillospiraceae bacterium]
MEQNFIDNVNPSLLSPTDVYEVKILLAYFLYQIEQPVTPAQLLEIATGENIVNYFLYSQAVTEMLENETIVLSEIEGIEYYVLTEKGKNGAVSFKKLVKKSVRDRIYAAGLRFFTKLRNSQNIEFNVRQLDKGYSVQCICKDGNINLMDITLFAPDKEQAEYIKSKISINPSDFYSNVIDYIIKNEEYVPSISEDN